MKEQKTELMPETSRYHRKQGIQTFGEIIATFRDTAKLAPEQAAEKLGISPEYLSDLETDRRYPPTGGLYERFKEVYADCGEPAQPDGNFCDAEYILDEVTGRNRKDISLDEEEFLRRNWFARYVLNLLFQIDVKYEDSDEDEEFMKIQTSLYKLAEHNGITIVPPEDGGNKED
jgi:transcriptional regulator with XRE-family HTH domain